MKAVTSDRMSSHYSFFGMLAVSSISSLVFGVLLSGKHSYIEIGHEIFLGPDIGRAVVVSGERMCTEKWLIAWVNPAQVRIIDFPNILSN